MQVLKPAISGMGASSTTLWDGSHWCGGWQGCFSKTRPGTLLCNKKVKRPDLATPKMFLEARRSGCEETASVLRWLTRVAIVFSHILRLILQELLIVRVPSSSAKSPRCLPPGPFRAPCGVERSFADTYPLQPGSLQDIGPSNNSPALADVQYQLPGNPRSSIGDKCNSMLPVPLNSQFHIIQP
jgi:hypothetical protein